MAYTDEVLADAPVAYWRLNETSGTSVADSSAGGTFVGTYVGTPTLNQSGPGPGLLSVLFGAGNYADFGDVLETGITQMSVEFWYKNTTLGSTFDPFITKGDATVANAWRVTRQSTTTNQMQLTFGNSQDVTGAAINDGLWHHFVATWDGTTIRAYADSVAGATAGPSAAVIGNNAAAVQIAHNAEQPSRSYSGQMSEVAVYFTVLSQVRITTHFLSATGLAVATPPMIISLVEEPAGAAWVPILVNAPPMMATLVVEPAPTSVPVPLYNTEVLADSPLVYWPLNEIGGLVATDLTSNARSGTYNSGATPGGGPELVSAAGPSALMANGSITIPTATWMDQTSWTVEIWFTTTGVTAGAGLACRDSSTGKRHWDLHINEGGFTGQVSVTVYTVDTVTGQVYSRFSSYTDGLRHHVVATYDTALLRLYIDGVEQTIAGPAGLPSPKAVTGINSVAVSEIRLGDHQGNVGMIGDLSSFAYYSTALSDSRIASHYVAGLATSPVVIKADPMYGQLVIQPDEAIWVPLIVNAPPIIMSWLLEPALPPVVISTPPIYLQTITPTTTGFDHNLGLVPMVVTTTLFVSDIYGDGGVGDLGTAITQISNSTLVMNMALYGRLQTQAPHLNFNAGLAASLRALAHTEVSVEDPAIINGRPWSPSIWVKPNSTMSVVEGNVSGVDHIVVVPDPEPTGDDTIDTKWPPGGKPNYLWRARDMATPPTGGTVISTWPEHWGGPSFKSAGKYRPTLKRRAIYGEGGRSNSYTHAVHFDPEDVDHMWVDLGSAMPQPYTVMIIGVVNNYPTRRYGHYLMDAGRASPSKDTTRDWLIDDNLTYRSLMLFQLTSGIVCSRPVVEDGVYARVNHNYKLRPRAFIGVFDGHNSYAGYHDPEEKALTKGRTDNNSVRFLVIGRKQNWISDNYASHMTLFEIRIWKKGLTPHQLLMQYHQIASTYKFSLYTKRGKA